MCWFLVRSQKIPVSEKQKSISKVFLMMIRSFIKRNSVLSWFIQEFVFSLSKLWYGGEGDPIQLRILLGDIPLARLRGYSKVLLILLMCTILRLRNLRYLFLIDGIPFVRLFNSRIPVYWFSICWNFFKSFFLVFWKGSWNQIFIFFCFFFIFTWKKDKKLYSIARSSDIGESSNGRTPDFDSVCPGSNPGSPVWELMRSRETVSRRAHNPKIGGSIPSSATKKYL